jgi:hypothetical protein
MRLRVEPRDVNREVVARRLGLSPPEFNDHYDNLIARGFPKPDPDTGRFDLVAIEKWCDARHALFADSTADSPPPQARSIRQKLRDAPLDGSAIRVALRAIYFRYPKRQGPNLNEVVPLVQDSLKNDGYKASKARIQEIAAEQEFVDRRGEVGKHRKRTLSSEK